MREKLKIVLIVFLAISCRDNRLMYTLDSVSRENTTSNPQINFYLETSLSMKGYVNTDVAGDYKLKDIVPYLITDLESKFSAIDLYTITDKPLKYTRNLSDFYNALRKGEIFTGKSSRLHQIFQQMVEDVDSASVNIVISDCILDFGDEDNLAEGGLLTHGIYQKLGTEVSAAVYKYTSDFNGNWYYDRKNTGGLNSPDLPKPYENIILHNRPFYIWVIGRQENLKEIISSGIIKDYDDAHFYNIDYTDIPVHLLSHPRKGKIFINTEQQQLTVNEVSKDRPILFTLGLDLSTLPNSLRNTAYLSKIIHISPAYLEQYATIEMFDEVSFTSVKNYEKVQGQIYKNKLSHFITISFTTLNENDTHFKLDFSNKQPSWIKDSHLEDDYQKSTDSLEGRTFALNRITDAFEERYNDIQLMEIQFTLKTKQ
ncbi:hypothetical protein [Spongiimicrobium salis]|uniref:hypothetical protein n=1 Tax=Spongiimicrobium salis TaxID=1667022 RepID=UPI00374DB966